MYLFCLLILPLGVIASPLKLNDTHLRQNKERLVNALVYFGKDNFSWPDLELAPIYHPSLKAEEIDEVEEEETPMTDIAEEDIVSKEVEYLGAIPEILESDADNAYTVVIPEDHPVAILPPEPVMAYTPVTRKPIYILHHHANDNPTDLENDVYHHTDADISGPICSFFQHSVLGSDFGESTFPRVSYVSTDALPYHVHYAPDDYLRFESYKWPFAACNHACELQALAIRALFDWELDPVNEDGGLDDETKRALVVAREICQWKNVHHYFAVDDCPRGDLRRRHLEDTGSLNFTAAGTQTSKD